MFSIFDVNTDIEFSTKYVSLVLSIVMLNCEVSNIILSFDKSIFMQYNPHITITPTIRLGIIIFHTLALLFFGAITS